MRPPYWDEFHRWMFTMNYFTLLTLFAWGLVAYLQVGQINSPCKVCNKYMLHVFYPLRGGGACASRKNRKLTAKQPVARTREFLMLQHKVYFQSILGLVSTISLAYFTTLSLTLWASPSQSSCPSLECVLISPTSCYRLCCSVYKLTITLFRLSPAHLLILHITPNAWLACLCFRLMTMELSLQRT